MNKTRRDIIGLILGIIIIIIVHFNIKNAYNRGYKKGAEDVIDTLKKLLDTPKIKPNTAIIDKDKDTTIDSLSQNTLKND